MLGMLQRERLRDVMTAPPEKACFCSLIGNETFDVSRPAPVMPDWIGAADCITKVAFPTGLDFRCREAAGHAAFLEDPMVLALSGNWHL